MPKVNQAIVVSLVEDDRSADRIFRQAGVVRKNYVYHLVDEVTKDNPVELTDRPAINIVETQSNRLLTRTLTFRVRAAAGVYALKQEHGASAVYQLDPTTSKQDPADLARRILNSPDGVDLDPSMMVDETAMLAQLQTLESFRNKLVNISCVVAPVFVGIVQDVRLTKGNDSRTVTSVEVVVREVLRGAKSDARFTFAPITTDPARNPNDDDPLNRLLNGESVEFGIGAKRLDNGRNPDIVHRVGQGPTSYDGIGFSNLLDAKNTNARATFDQLSNGFQTLAGRGSFEPASVWIIEDFGNSIVDRTSFTMNVGLTGGAQVPLSFYYESKDGEASRLSALTRQYDWTPSQFQLPADAMPFTAIRLQRPLDPVTVPEAIVPQDRLRAPYRSDVEAIAWVQPYGGFKFIDTSAISTKYRMRVRKDVVSTTVVNEQNKEPRVWDPRELPPINTLGSKYFIALVFGSRLKIERGI